MDKPYDVLACREQNGIIMQTLAQSGNAFSVKANVPGADKRVAEGAALVRHYVALLLREFGGEAIFYDGADGYFAAITKMKPADARSLKDFAVRLEEETPVGRYVDIDLMPKGEKRSLSRGYMRRCYLCGEAAFVCARRGAHPREELLSALKRDARDYFTKAVISALKESALSELRLENKFGLVTPTHSGSHKDIDYEVMLASQGAIIPKLAHMFWTGFDAPCADGLLAALRPEGIETEKAMFAASGGVNTYKGLVFAAGILLACAGRALSSKETRLSAISDIARAACRGVVSELESCPNTAGATAYKLYGVKGARGSAERGFPAAFEAEKMIDDDFSDESLLKALCYIVGNIEDTVLLKRCKSYEKYDYYKRKISSVDTADKKAVEALNDECLRENISIGGSADLLIAAILLKKLRALWYFE